ncbi:MFS transporter [Bacillus sp. V-88]|uniref:MFS transporter n=1 Tax=Rossellomorea vietnamensis TaxID=218284 RepID=A0A6I6UNT8_9BACI|nr:MFS transporter [Rossellomorea vietnamensis]OXS64589.1 MFS transporter [Bacillus sp. DSM 27956]PRX79749.1 MFS transporter [Bacillus sp. V-88]QHE60372.1 MFS transporter [Rossellomorea vietnamensis]SLK03421.1 Major Facilitator Superfamily protein [Bacillus sp. V-88]
MKSLVFKYNSYYFLSNLVFQKGIFMLFLTTQRGLDNSEIAILQMSLLGGMFLSEVPTGILGDRFGRKFSVVTGLTLLTLSSLGFIMFEHFWVLAVLFFLEGLGMSFISGSDQSLLYDNLKKMDEEEQFLKTMSNSLALSYVSLAIASIVGGAIQGVSWNLVYGLSSIAILGSIIFFLSIKELSITETESIDTLTKKVISQKKNIMSETSHYFKSYEGRKILLVFILLGAFEATCMSYFMFSQQFFHMLGLNVFVISLVFMGGRLFSGFSYFIAPKLANKFSSRKVIVSTMLGTSFVLILNIFDLSFYYYISFVAIVIFPYISNVLNVNFIHSKIPSLTRASIMSVGSMIGSVSLGLSYLMIGFLLDVTSLNITTATIGLINLATALLYINKTKRMDWGQINDKAA